MPRWSNRSWFPANIAAGFHGNVLTSDRSHLALNKSERERSVGQMSGCAIHQKTDDREPKPMTTREVAATRVATALIAMRLGGGRKRGHFASLFDGRSTAMPHPGCASTGVERRHAAARITTTRRQSARRLCIACSVAAMSLISLELKLCIGSIVRRRPGTLS
jgi:hypothetical protein